MEDETNNSYGKKFFTPKNIIIYFVIAALIYGAVYSLFLSKKGTNSPYTAPTPTSSVTQTTPTAAVTPSSIILDEVNTSGESGLVTLTESNGKTTVDVVMTKAPAGSKQPAHIHKGGCPGIGDVLFPLTDVVDGKSTTVLDVDMASLKAAMPLAINVHKSTAEIAKYVACGDLK